MASIVLKLNKIDPREIDVLRKLNGVDSKINNMVVKTKFAEGFASSKQIQDLIDRMLSLDPQNLPNLDELKIHCTASGTQVSMDPVSTEAKKSTQIKEIVNSLLLALPA